MPHAKEPWFAYEGSKGESYIAVHPQGHVILAEMHGISSFNPPERFGNHNENRMRILQCVNALAGMNPASLASVVAVLKSAATQLEAASEFLAEDSDHRAKAAEECNYEAVAVRTALQMLTGKRD